MYQITRQLRSILLSVGILGIGLMLLIGTGIKLYNETAVQRSGTQTSGEVIAKEPYIETSNDGKRFQRYKLVFRFTDANGGEFENWNDVEKATYDAVSVGQAIDVYYFPDDPNQSFVDMEGKISRNALQLGVGGVMTVLGLFGVLTLKNLSHFRKQDDDY